MRYDMQCLDCGSIHEVVCSYSQLEKRKLSGPYEVPHYRGPCAECEGESLQVQHYPMDQERNHIHSQHSGMYGKFHPGFGCVVEDYGHKQQLLRRYDLREAHDKVDGAPGGWGDSDDGTNYDYNRPEEVRASNRAESERKQKAVNAIQWR
jgi:hypothetical protein